MHFFLKSESLFVTFNFLKKKKQFAQPQVFQNFSHVYGVFC
jgi:hypothetical protein